jgi:hypothetical protein
MKTMKYIPPPAAVLIMAGTAALATGCGGSTPDSVPSV